MTTLRTRTHQGRRNAPTQRQLEALKPTQFQPGVSGNPGGRPAKPFAAALLRIVEKKIANDPEGRALLDVIAQQLVDKARKGSLPSIMALAERIDGKPQQAVTLGGDGSNIPIEIASMTMEQKRQRVAQLLAKARGTEN